MKYASYFLIVSDYIKWAKKNDIPVGPGRGSGAGSLVAWALSITDIDPIKFDLIFERFLNPDRISMPDFDIDFCEEKRDRVFEYLKQKYGKGVAHIITFGKLKARMAFRDIGRVLGLPYGYVDTLCKMIPFEPSRPLSLIQCINSEPRFQKLIKEDSRVKKLTDLSLKLEGLNRNIATHAAGVVIADKKLTEIVPLYKDSSSDLLLPSTQFDMYSAENAGLVKFDFLGLKTLTVIKKTEDLINANNKEFKIENINYEDQKVYKLLSSGKTVGLFQLESSGMREALIQMQPNRFEDIIALVALYRPGPMEYIPSFVRRKHGDEDIEYDLPAMEEYLKETYGITVYQEQVMLLSQKLADFTKGEADVLRKAMGKKQIAVLDKMKPKFIEQASAKGHDAKKLEKIWKDWEAFASYAFNKSHSTCYAWIAYQTAYLKAHYPAEYMASVLSNNMNDIKSVSFFMEECKRMGLEVLGPDVNESYLKFSVNKEGSVRFGMGAIKGVGGSAVKAIIKERKENGPYKSIFDVTKRVDLRAANKKAFDGLILAGGFDSFTSTHRSQYFALDEKGQTFIEKAIRFGNKYQENLNSSQVSLFGEASEIQFPEPDIPNAEEWGTMERLAKEKEVVGIYISAHPLDDFKNELKFCNAAVVDFKGDLNKNVGANLSFGGIVTEVQHRVSKSGKGWAIFVVEDYSDSYEFKIFGEEYLKYKHFLVPNSFLYIRTTILAGWVNREGVQGDARLKFTDFKLLHDVMDDMCKKITVKIPIQHVNEKSVAAFESIFKNNNGKQSLRFVIYDVEEEVELDVSSRNTKIKITSELLQTLEKQHVNFKLN